MRLSIKDMILVGLFAALMIVGTFLKIPNPLFPTVPITLQLFFCIFAGLLLGAYKGLISQGIYVMLGLVGIPVFAGGGGLDYIFKPTFGFILSFIFVAALVGYLLEKQKGFSLTRLLTATSLGVVLSYIIGIGYMYLVRKFYSGADITVMALVIAMAPYFIKDIALAVLASLSALKIIPILKKAGY